MKRVVLGLCALVGCGRAISGDHVDGATGDMASVGDDDQQGCATRANCYSVYAHSDTMLYVVDLASKTLTTVGPFMANSEVITDLAVGTDDTIYVISKTKLYTASATDGHVTPLASLSGCGTSSVALTTLPNGQLWTGDYRGALCQIDTSTMPPTVKPPVKMESGLALAGDLVAVDNGTVFGTAYRVGDPTNGGTSVNNILVAIDLTTGAVNQRGAIGFPKLFGASFTDNHVIGFTHDGSGRAVAIDPQTGAGTIYATFKDPTTQAPISFAGAGVNSLVPILL